MNLTSRHVHVETFEYYTVRIPDNASAAEVALLRAELEVFRDDYYGSEAPLHPIERWQRNTLRFSTVRTTLGQNLNPLVYSTIVDAEEIARKRLGYTT